MRKLMLLLGALILAGCAGDPLMSGRAQDWMGKPSANLRAVLGEPTRILPESNDTEVWEYVKSGEFIAPKREDTTFGMGGGGGSGMFGASGGISTIKSDGGPGRYENIWRFKIKNAKVKGWWAERRENGRTVWQDH